jgi:acyl-CoA synthetase (AMP-forming)/AMP-acid ligase II/thioesterase domain-containing protein/acyl carrier protein
VQNDELTPQPAIARLSQSPIHGTASATNIEAGETIADIVRRHAEARPDAPALVAEGQAPLTYAALAGLMGRIRERLNTAGFGRGDRIAVVGPNDAATAALVTGIWGCAAAVPMNPALSAGEFAIYFRDLKVQAVAVVGGVETVAGKVAKEIGLPALEIERVDNDVAGMIDIRRFPGGRKAARPGTARGDDLALVLLTSGTTSHSKVVPVTNSQLTAKMRWEVEAYGLTPADRCLNLMPLFHGHGLYCSLGSTLCSGSSIVTLTEFSPDAFFRLLRQQLPTWYTGAYTFHHRIRAAAPDYAEAIRKSRLRFAKTASGPLDLRVAEDISTLLHAPVIAAYSSTELGGITSTPFPPSPQKLDTVGRPHGRDVAVMTPDGKLLPPGEIGEVAVRSAETFTGYENDAAETARCFVGGWFRTGDEGFLDEDGYLTLTGRIKDIINRGGEKITPSEVDNALMGHPDVATAVTFPMPHPTLGQEVAVAIVLRKGAEMTDETLTHFLRGRLAPFKVPRRFIFVDDIPKGASGKIQRRILADAFGLVTDSVAGGQERIADDRPPTALEARLQRIWAEALGLERVGLYEDFFMLGGDSLQAVDLFLRIEKEVGRRLPRSVLFEAGTVAKMAHRIEEFVASPCLVPIQPKGNLPPFFCVHDGNAEVLKYRELARLVGDRQPFYGIQSRGLDGEEEPFTDIDEMAAYYVQEIRNVQPEGPYYIGGYSFGGRVAYVMAQILRAAGEEVALLALIDTFCHAGQARVGWRKWLALHRERLREQTFFNIPAYLWLRVKNLVELTFVQLRRKSYAAAWRFYKSRGKPLPRLLWRPVPANDMIRHNYRARPYDGDAVLFKAQRNAWNHPDEHDGWYGLIKGRLEVRPIPGTHFEIMNQPHVRTVAAELADVLEQARATQMRRNRISAEAS